MKKSDNFESELPVGYHPVFEIDATGKKTGLLLNGAALIILLVILIPAFLMLKPLRAIAGFTPAPLLIFAVSCFTYIILHELLHGAAYKLLTERKLTFGLTLTVAYCGVPDIFVYRRTALIALLTPFVVFIPVFLIPVLVLSDPIEQFLAVILLAMHVSGCVGDLYDTLLYLIRFRRPDTLMQDTGPKQVFYLPEA